MYDNNYILTAIMLIYRRTIISPFFRVNSTPPPPRAFFAVYTNRGRMPKLLFIIPSPRR